jgi:hypothetical protein
MSVEQIEHLADRLELERLRAECERLKVKLQAVWLAASGGGCTSVAEGTESHSDALDKVNSLRIAKEAAEAKLAAMPSPERLREMAGYLEVWAGNVLASELRAAAEALSK